MKLKVFKLFFLLVFIFHNAISQKRVFGLITVEDENFSVEDVFIYDSNSKFLTTPDKKGFYEFLTNKSEIKIVYLLVGSQFNEKQVMLNENNEVNIHFKTK